MHRLAVGSGWLSAPDFWAMAPGPIWWVIEDRLPEQAVDRAETNARLYRMVKEAQAREAAQKES